MPDYYADPVWDAANEAMVSVEALPISDGLRMAVRSWGQRWTELASPDDPPSSLTAAELLEALERDGRSLCERMREELGPAWRVGWVSFDDDGQRYVQWEPSSTPTLFPPGSGS